VTRSQALKSKGSGLRKQGCKRSSVAVKVSKEANSCESDSGKTTESMVKIANEALEIGELLGIKVVSHRKNAVKRITSSLKHRRS